MYNFVYAFTFTSDFFQFSLFIFVPYRFYIYILGFMLKGGEQLLDPRVAMMPCALWPPGGAGGLFTFACVSCVWDFPTLIQERVEPKTFSSVIGFDHVNVFHKFGWTRARVHAPSWRCNVGHRSEGLWWR